MTTRVLTGDCRDVLATLPEASVHCCVTSPPYWGLRDYGIPPSVWGGDPACEHTWGDAGIIKSSAQRDNPGGGVSNPGASRGNDSSRRTEFESSTGAFCQSCGAWCGAHGLEPQLDLYVRNAVEVFRAVRRVLRSDGVCWVNLGDSYANNGQSGLRNNSGGTSTLGATTGPPGRGVKQWDESARPARASVPGGLKSKDLCGVPWRVAFALQSDGWWLRQDVIWAKPNAMPESVTDRCTKAHEYLFMLTKSARYYFDADAIKEDNAESGKGLAIKQRHVNAKTVEDRNDYSSLHGIGVNPAQYNGLGRNKRSVWTVATAPYSDAHFATFPPALIEPAILSSTSAKGCCAACGAPWRRVTARIEPSYWEQRKSHDFGDRKQLGDNYKSISKGRPDNSGVGYSSMATTGWEPGCACGAEVVPATVLDCFFGSGTTGLVCDRLQRDCIGIDLNASYVAMAAARITDDAPLLANLAAE